MSSNDVTVYGEEHGEAEADSVYDFLYHDSRRIGSFLSQFDDNGLLTGLNHGETAARGSKRGWKFGAGADLPMLAGAKVELERQPGESGSETLERSYDPFWTNARTFLDYLDERSLIQPQLEEATFGQFVLARGRLTVLDLAMFKDAWKLSTIQRAMKASNQPDPAEGNRQQRRSQGKNPLAAATMPSDADIAIELMTVLPHTVNATITTDEEETVWSVLRDEYMVTPSAELVLANGSGMPGEWAMLGILNGRPDFGETELQQQIAQIHSTLPVGLTTSGVGNMMAILSPLIRQTLGRPAAAYGVTPLLVFREVT